MNFYSIIATFSLILLIYKLKEFLYALEETNRWKLIFLTTSFGLIGAKIFHILENYALYYSKPELLQLTKGFSIMGAIVFSYITILFFEHKEKVKLSDLKTNLFLYLPLVQSIGRIGNITNQELLPFSYYEIILNILNFFFLYFISKKNKNLIVSFFFINYGLIRIFIEILKGNYSFLFLTSVIFFVYGFLMVFKLRYKV